MDQIKTGRFIAELRKEKGLTQRALADALLISDKTVSKWETGKGMPEISLMMPLCGQLDITVNELLSGERLNDSDYKKKAEENMMDLIREKAENKKKITLSVAVAVLTIVSGVAMILVAGLTELPVAVRIMLGVLAAVEIMGGIAVAAVLDMEAGTFECRHCGHRFVPTAKAYIMGPHSITTRKLTCPACGKKSYCKRRLTH